MVTLGKQVQVQLTQQRTKAVGVFAGVFATGPMGLQLIRLGAVKMAHEQTRDMRGVEAGDLLTRATGQHPDAQCLGQERPDDHPALPVRMRTQHRKRIAVPRVDQCLNVFAPRHQTLTHNVADTHDCSPSGKGFAVSGRWLSKSLRPCRGTRIQAGRFVAS